MQKIIISLINFYQSISPKTSQIFGSACRFSPTCSQYAKEAILKYGFGKGGTLAIKRIFHCHPWGNFGYDPVP